MDTNDGASGAKITMSNGSMRPQASTDTLAFLRQVPLFQAVPEQRLSEIASRLEERHYSRNEEILRQGTITGDIFLVKSGLVAVTRASIVTGETHTLAHFKQGDLLGEVEVLSSSQGVAMAAATATALTETDLLVMKGSDFTNLLHSEASVSLALARTLAQRLRATNERIGIEDGLENRICLVIGNGRGAGVTTIGTALAVSLAATTRNRTAYTEYPDAARLHAALDVAPQATEATPYNHQGGFEVPAVTQQIEQYPTGWHATLFIDRLTLSYPNIVIGLTGELDASLEYLLERTDQVVVVTSPDPEQVEPLMDLVKSLKKLLHADRSSLYIVSNRNAPDDQSYPLPPYADFDVPYLDDLPAPAGLSAENLPAALSSIVATLADRVKRTNQVRMYIPTTMDVDRQIDTMLYVQRALNLLGDMFGGATSDDAQGVWKSDTAGLVGETVYIVTSYVTQTDLDRHLGSILDFVEGLKVELRQEAMALEINERLMLI